MPTREIMAAISVLASAAALAACGGAPAPGTAGAGTQGPAAFHSRALAFAACMRSHGVTNFPDPSVGSGGIQLGKNLNPFSPTFKAAQSRCRGLLPGGGPGAHPPSAQDKAQMLAISVCMRAHGITGFPDPTLTPPSSPAGFSLVLGRDGVFLAVPSTIAVQSPAFRRAATTCRFGTRRPG